MRLLFLIIVFLSLELSLLAQTTLPTFIVAGQSNARRLGYSRYPKSVDPTVVVNSQFWQYANPSCPDETNLNTTLSNFEPNSKLALMGSGIADALSDSGAFPEGFAIINYAACGTSLNTEWRLGDPTGIYEAYFKPFINDGLAAISASGRTPDLQAMFWHQGEGDSRPQNVSSYQTNLSNLIEQYASDFGSTPFIMGEIVEYNAEDTAINKTMLKVASEYTNVNLVPTRDLDWNSDPDVHFTAFGAHDASARYVAILTVPEPSSTALLGLGSLGLLARRKR